MTEHYIGGGVTDNGKGKLTGVVDLSGTSFYAYDVLGRIKQAIKRVDGLDYVTDTTYDGLGRIEHIAYPARGTDPRETVRYAYDAGSNLTEVINDATLVNTVTYGDHDALGRPGAIQYANGVTETAVYDPLTFRLSETTLRNGSGQLLQSLSYAYDSVGNVTGIADHLNTDNSQDFLYDDLNRLDSATSFSYGAPSPNTIDYEYDQVGNIVLNPRVAPTPYDYGTTQPCAVKTVGSRVYAYDANGNMTTRPGQSLDYDFENRLAKIFNASRERASSPPSSTTTRAYALRKRSRPTNQRPPKTPQLRPQPERTRRSRRSSLVLLMT